MLDNVYLNDKLGDCVIASGYYTAYWILDRRPHGARQR